MDGIPAVGKSPTITASSRHPAIITDSGRALSPEEALAPQTTTSGARNAYRADISASDNGRPFEATPVRCLDYPPVLQHPIGPDDNQAGPSLPDNNEGIRNNTSEKLTELSERIRKLEEASASRTEARAKSPDWLLKISLDKSRDLGKSRWMGKPQEFSVMIDCYTEIIGKDSGKVQYKTPETASLVAQSRELIRKCKAAAKSTKRSRPSRSHESSYEIGLPPREMSDAMINLYFSSFESTHRILHGPSFWAEYKRYWDSPDHAPTDVRLKISLVIGLGSSLYSHQSTDEALGNADLVHRWIYAAQKWLSGPLEKDRLTIGGLQIYCLTILARQIFSVGGDLTWISTGSLVQIAMQMGLHRDPSYLPSITSLQAEIRRRLWATIVELVVQSSLDSWMPPRISVEEFDVKPPSNLNDEDLDEATTVTNPRPEDVFTDTSFQLTLLESLPIRLRIVQLLNQLNSEPTYPQVLELSLALTKALHACASKTKQDSEHNTPFRRNLLDYLIRRFALPLHTSFSSRARLEPTYRHSRQASLDAALAILSPEPDPRFARLMAFGGGMFREGQRCALLAVGMELIAHLEAQRLDGTLGRTGAYRGVLKGAVRDLLELSEERVRLGETNVKSHMFLSMILAQVEAVEAGLPVELQVARSARDSLELCYGILSARASSLPASLMTPSDAGTGAAGFGENGFESYNVYGMGMDFDWDSIMSDVGFS